MSLLSVKNLTKRFGSVLAVNDLSFSVNAGEILAVMGPNGAGKSTLFSMIAGYLKPDQGEIWFGGQHQVKQGLWRRVRSGLGYVPQQTVGFVDLTLWDNMVFSKMTDQAIEESLHNVGLQDRHQVPLGQLSGGERRRFDLARCLIQKPSVMILDEPFAGLDPIAIQDLCLRIRELANEGLAVVVSDHSVQTTLRLCHQAIIMDFGTCVLKGTPREVSESQLVRERYLGWGAE
ncbi:MAG: ATP-binding cassette domain-containing protein [Myxococcota bacterium]